MARILIIDDSPTETYFFKRLLEENGYSAVSANNAEEGLAIAKRDKPDLILMDVVMPGMNGFQATRKLAKDPETSSIPIVVVTTKDQETDRIWALRQGARDYMVKPPDRSEFLAKIRALIDSASDSN